MAERGRAAADLARLGNDLEAPAISLCPEIAETLKKALWRDCPIVCADERQWNDCLSPCLQ
jgi:4-diphosphocytidyl-2C-methyl-D-erythritol kinase